LILDVVTVQIVAAISHFLIGALHLIPGLTREGKHGWARSWGWGKILIGLANGLTLFFDGSNVALVERLLNLMLIVGMALCVRSVALFGRRSPPRILLAMMGATGLGLIALMLLQTTDVRWTVAMLGSARNLCLIAITWLMLGIARREKLFTAWVMGGFFIAATPLFVLHMLFSLLAFSAPAWEQEAQWIADWAAGVGIIVVTLTHFSLLLVEAERNQRELRQQACIDGLTGALNRFGLDRVEESLHGDVTVLLIDIDRFKALNDQHGHAAGDMVLRLLTDLALSELGQRGRVARIGGDEFLCVLPSGTAAEAEALRKALSHRFDRAVIAAIDVSPPPTLSIGIAAGSIEDGLDRLVHQADEAMYRVKRGRQSRDARAAVA
jgi:diguanylate cyclase (GGDEF)-like protein